mgnify:CR=1 FL=1
MKYFIKIIFVLLIITSLFGRYKWEQDPAVIRQIYVLNENYMKHYPNQIEWKSESQVLLIHNMQQAIRKIEKGQYQKYKSQEIANVIQEYVDIEKKHQNDLKLLKKELKT